MPKTIGNPLSWSGEAIIGSGRWFGRAVEALGSRKLFTPVVRKLKSEDIGRALRAGVEDFAALRTDVLFLVVVYPVIGVMLSMLAFNMNLLPLVFPISAGFALLGPLAATGLYVMSKRRERGEPAGWQDAIAALGAETVGPVLTLGAYLVVVFVIWLYMADAIYSMTLGPAAPASVSTFVADVFGTPAGWEMIIAGTAVGFVLAAVVLVTSVVSFPMLVDRRVGLPVAVATSLKVTKRNPAVVAAWGVIVAVLLLIGSLPMFLGLVIVLPVLGHATWHLYRAAVDFGD